MQQCHHERKVTGVWPIFGAIASIVDHVKGQSFNASISMRTTCSLTLGYSFVFPLSYSLKILSLRQSRGVSPNKKPVLGLASLRK